ncbi:MAG: extracellular solute-binding protein [Erysipelotrichaceae bacterium]|nr:extracellular solute-binding protein [Erysipelotrichaceae bacterium]
MKKIICVLFVLLMSLSLSACHGSEGKASFVTPEEFDTSRNYEISFWAKNDTNRTQVDIYEKAIEDFEKLYPNIKVNMRLYTDYGRIYNDVITNISTNTTPNVCITYPDHIATYLTGENTVVALDDLFDNEKYGLGGSEVRFDAPKKEEIVPQFLEECYFGDHYYAIPYMRSTEATYINKDMVEALGYEVPDVLTWDFIFEVSEKALEKDEEGNFKINGQKVMIPFIYKSTDNMMISMLKQKSTEEELLSDDQGNIYLFNDTTRDILYEVNKHAKSGAFSTFKISSYPANFLNAGQCIFAIDSTAGATWMGSRAVHQDIAESSIIDFETVVRPIPQYDTENRKMISQGPSLCIFNKEDPQEVLASWLFMQYMITNDVQIAYGETEGYVPVTLKAQNDPAYLDYISRKGEDNDLYYDVKIEASQLLVDNVADTFTTPVFNGSASLRDASGQLIEEVTKAARRNITVDDAYMEKLFSDITSLYRLNETSAAGGGRRELGPLPTPSIVLLSSLAGIWVLIGLYVLKERKNLK